jgi:prepilin signal peptidase PulO-like enzyme (type II secretory pathway)
MYQFATPVIGLIFSGLIIYYLRHLEKLGCLCAMTPQRNYIYYYTIILVLFNLVNLFLLPNMNKNSVKPFAMIMGPIAILLLIGGVINIVYTIEFVQDMKKKNCECSKSVFREMMFILAILQVISWLFLILLLLVAIIYRNGNTMKLLMKAIKKEVKIKK